MRSADDLAQEVSALRERNFALDHRVANLLGILDLIQQEIDVAERHRLGVVSTSSLKWVLRERANI